MATFAWTRQYVTAQTWNGAAASHLVVKLNTGQSIIQTWVAWGFSGNTSTTVIPTAIMGQVAALGAVTTIGNGSETPPDALAAPGNASPPSQRWLIWEVRAPVIAAWEPSASTAMWRSSDPAPPGDTESQILAPSAMGVGNTLNLWLSWNEVGAWDASGQAVLWCAVQVLVRSP